MEQEQTRQTGSEEAAPVHGAQGTRPVSYTHLMQASLPSSCDAFCKKAAPIVKWARLFLCPGMRQAERKLAA